MRSSPFLMGWKRLQRQALQQSFSPEVQCGIRKSSIPPTGWDWRWFSPEFATSGTEVVDFWIVDDGMSDAPRFNRQSTIRNQAINNPFVPVLPAAYLVISVLPFPAYNVLEVTIDAPALC